MQQLKTIKIKIILITTYIGDGELGRDLGMAIYYEDRNWGNDIVVAEVIYCEAEIG